MPASIVVPKGNILYDIVLMIFNFLMVRATELELDIKKLCKIHLLFIL